MDPTANLLQQLQCPVCLETCVAPIYQCANGHNLCPECCARISICALCRSPITTTRNRFAEQVSAQLHVTRKMRATAAEKPCVHAPTYRCYVVDNYSRSFEARDQCQWRGDASHLLAHTLATHADSVIFGAAAEIECAIRMDLDYGTAYVRLLSAYDELFWCIVFYDPGEANAHVFVRFVGGDKMAGRFTCEHRFADATGARRLAYTSEPLRTGENIREGCRTLQLNEDMVVSFSDGGMFKYRVEVSEK